MRGRILRRRWCYREGLKLTRNKGDRTMAFSAANSTPVYHGRLGIRFGLSSEVQLVSMAQLAAEAREARRDTARISAERDKLEERNQQLSAGREVYKNMADQVRCRECNGKLYGPE